MNTRTRAALAFVLGLAALGALPALGRAMRGDGPVRCALDGVEVAAARRVRVVDATGAVLDFCCVDCAKTWVASAAAAPRGILVTDEATGAEVRAEAAHFVLSSVVACAATGCRIHVFADEAAARRNAESFRGVLLTGDARPFQVSR